MIWFKECDSYAFLGFVAIAMRQDVAGSSNKLVERMTILMLLVLDDTSYGLSLMVLSMSPSPR